MEKTIEFQITQIIRESLIDDLENRNKDAPDAERAFANAIQQIFLQFLRQNEFIEDSEIEKLYLSVSKIMELVFFKKAENNYFIKCQRNKIATIFSYIAQKISVEALEMVNINKINSDLIPLKVNLSIKYSKFALKVVSDEHLKEQINEVYENQIIHNKNICEFSRTMISKFNDIPQRKPLLENKKYLELEQAEDFLYQKNYEKCLDILNCILQNSPQNLPAKLIKLKCLVQQKINLTALELMHEIVLENFRCGDSLDLLDKIENITEWWIFDEDLRNKRMRIFNLYHILTVEKSDDLKNEYTKNQLKKLKKYINPIQDSLAKLELSAKSPLYENIDDFSVFLKNLTANVEKLKETSFWDSEFGYWFRENITFVLMPTINKILVADKNLYVNGLEFLFWVSKDLNSNKKIKEKLRLIKNPVDFSLSRQITKEEKNRKMAIILSWVIIIIGAIILSLHRA